MRHYSCFVGLFFICTSRVLANDAISEWAPCAPPAELSPPAPCCQHKCECIYDSLAKKSYYRCGEACNYPDGLEKDEDLQNQLRCMWKDSPGQGESAAWAVELTCGYRLTELKKSYLAASVDIGACHPSSRAVAQVHTHPFRSPTGQTISPRPSAPDRAVAAKCNVPVYVLSDTAIWKVLPDGTLVQVASDGWHARGCLGKPSK